MCQGSQELLLTVVAIPDHAQVLETVWVAQGKTQADLLKRFAEGCE